LVAKRSAADIAKAKEAKQKKILLVLLPFFLLLVAWQGPKMYKSLFAQPAPPEAVPQTPAPATPAPGTAAPGTLPDSEPLPSAAHDQLLSFSRFSPRNPFLPPVGAVPEATDPGGETPAVSSAVIEVNGVSETVSVNGTFPAADPIFQLVSLSQTAAVVGLTSGAFEGGQANVQIAVGERVELVADDGATYTVTVVSVS
ncbi:MAG: hypothetical protein ACRDNN_05140, partial [Gaiellaceae bacterium]